MGCAVRYLSTSTVPLLEHRQFFAFLEIGEESFRGLVGWKEGGESTILGLELSSSFPSSWLLVCLITDG